MRRRTEPRGPFARRTSMNRSSRACAESPYRATSILLAALLLGLLTACGSSSSPRTANDPANDSGNQPAGPIPAPGVPDEPVFGFGMVLDKGQGPELCLGPIAESYPPQCGGIPLDGWDWASRNDFEDISGVKFAMYAVTGTFDGTRMTVTQEPISGALYDPAPDPTVGRATSTLCPVPDGGWAILDRATANANALVRAETAAFELDGYVTHWNDQFSGLEISVPEEVSPDPDPEMGDDGTLDPLRMVLNVQVAGDIAEATETMRRVWGGALCVTNPRFTEQELTNIATALAKAPGITTAVPQYDRVVLEVLYDDGTLQDYVNDAYGVDTVVVVSSLRTAD